MIDWTYTRQSAIDRINSQPDPLLADLVALLDELNKLADTLASAMNHWQARAKIAEEKLRNAMKPAGYHDVDQFYRESNVLVGPDQQTEYKQAIADALAAPMVLPDETMVRELVKVMYPGSIRVGNNASVDADSPSKEKRHVWGTREDIE